MTCLKEQARPAKNISQRGTRSATNWPVLQSLSLFVQISLPLLRAGQWLSVSQEQQRDSAASTQSAKCTCSWLFSPSVLVKKNKQSWEKPRLKHTDPQPHINNPTLGKSVYSTTDCWESSQTEEILFQHWWCIFEFAFEWVYLGAKYEKSEPKRSLQWPS